MTHTVKKHIFILLFFNRQETRSPSPALQRARSPEPEPSRERSPSETRQPRKPRSPSRGASPSSRSSSSSRDSRTPERSRSHSEGEIESDERRGEVYGDVTDPYSTKNRKRYQKSKEKRKSPTVKERFQWKPPEEEFEDEQSPRRMARDGEAKRVTDSREETGTRQLRDDEENVQSENNESQESKPEDRKREEQDQDGGHWTELEARLEALASGNRKIQAFVAEEEKKAAAQLEEEDESSRDSHNRDVIRSDTGVPLSDPATGQQQGSEVENSSWPLRSKRARSNSTGPNSPQVSAERSLADEERHKAEDDDDDDDDDDDEVTAAQVSKQLLPPNAEIDEPIEKKRHSRSSSSSSSSSSSGSSDSSSRSPSRERSKSPSPVRDSAVKARNQSKSPRGPDTSRGRELLDKHDTGRQEVGRQDRRSGSGGRGSQDASRLPPPQQDRSRSRGSSRRSGSGRRSRYVPVSACLMSRPKKKKKETSLFPKGTVRKPK